MAYQLFNRTATSLFCWIFSVFASRKARNWSMRKYSTDFFLTAAVLNLSPLDFMNLSRGIYLRLSSACSALFLSCRCCFNLAYCASSTPYTSSE